MLAKSESVEINSLDLTKFLITYIFSNSTIQSKYKKPNGKKKHGKYQGIKVDFAQRLE